MREVIYFPVHGNRRGGTGISFYGGFAYGATDPVTLKPDRGTDLFAPSLTTEVDEAADASDGDTWLARAGVKSTHAQKVRPTAVQPATIALTKARNGGHEAVKAHRKDRAANAKTRAQVAAVQRAIAAGKVDPHKAKAKAQRVAEHGLRMRQRAHEAYNAIAILESQLLRDDGKGQSLAAHRRVLAKMRGMADRLQAIASRDQALHNAVSVATMTAARHSGYMGFGQDDTGTDARDAEEHAAILVSTAAEEIAAGNVAGAEVQIANAEGAFQQANRRMTAEAAAGDVFAQVSAALEPGQIPWGKIAIGAALVALARQVLR